MDVRDATSEDTGQIRSVAVESMKASYGHAFDDETLETAVEEWYDPAEMTEALTDEHTVFVVAVDEGDVVGFAQSYVSEGHERVGEVDWLHVVPDHRGEGLGDQLLKRVEQVLVDADVERIEGRVLTENETGTTFYEEHGFSTAGERTLDIAGETFTERVYSKLLDEEGDHEVTEERTLEDGTTVYVAYDEAARGSQAPFYGVYLDRDRSERYGWMCGQDESFDIAMDTMERVECNTCGNRRKPARWDAAYL
jgi:ribosomal protein S18 acetylase RimI-like enzyme